MPIAITRFWVSTLSLPARERGLNLKALTCNTKKGNNMKKILTIGIVALLSSLLSSCSGIDGAGSGGTNPSNANFYQHWVHSFEEQNGAKTPNIFRPKGSREFPAARFRMEFGFDASGQCNYKFLSPTDRHEMRNCVYTKVGNKVYLYDDQGKNLSHLAFTLQQTTSKDLMKMSYGVKRQKL